jgi:hypothetical protein
MEKNIRTGSNTDLTTLTPALIPFHDVITNIGSPDDMIKSYAGYNAVHAARMKQVNPISGETVPSTTAMIMILMIVMIVMMIVVVTLT